MTGSSSVRPLAVMITPRAERQILEAVQWWREHRPSAPTMLDDEIAEAFLRVAAHPHSGVAVRARLGTHRVLLRGSSYFLFYRVRPRARRIEVVALWHTSRGPRPGS